MPDIIAPVFWWEAVPGEAIIHRFVYVTFFVNKTNLSIHYD